MKSNLSRSHRVPDMKPFYMDWSLKNAPIKHYTLNIALLLSLILIGKYSTDVQFFIYPLTLHTTTFWCICQDPMGITAATGLEKVSCEWLCMLKSVALTKVWLKGVNVENDIQHTSRTLQCFGLKCIQIIGFWVSIFKS